MTQAVLCRESMPVIDLRGGTFTGPVCDSGRTGRLERDMDRMEEILEKVEERLNSLEGYFDKVHTHLGYIRVAVKDIEGFNKAPSRGTSGSLP